MEFREFIQELGKIFNFNVDVSTTPREVLDRLEIHQNRRYPIDELERIARAQSEKRKMQRALAPIVPGEAETALDSEKTNSKGDPMEPTLTQFITRLFAEMNIKDFSDDIDADEAFELVKQKLAPLKEQLVDEAVDAAFAQNKLHPDELDFALGMAKENLEAFNAFVAARRPIPKLSAVLKARGFKPPLRVVPSKLQDEINKQIGVSPELFKKYNPEG